MVSGCLSVWPSSNTEDRHVPIPLDAEQTYQSSVAPSVVVRCEFVGCREEQRQGSLVEGGAAPRAPHVHPVATISGQTPVHHSKMHPPKKPIEP
jgi:hypothetical protein